MSDMILKIEGTDRMHCEMAVENTLKGGWHNQSSRGYCE